MNPNVHLLVCRLVGWSVSKLGKLHNRYIFNWRKLTFFISTILFYFHYIPTRRYSKNQEKNKQILWAWIPEFARISYDLSRFDYKSRKSGLSDPPWICWFPFELTNSDFKTKQFANQLNHLGIWIHWHRRRIFPRLSEPIFTRCQGQTHPKISPKTPFLCHNFGQAMSNWLLGDFKLNIRRSPDPEILVSLHVRPVDSWAGFWKRC